MNDQTSVEKREVPFLDRAIKALFAMVLGVVAIGIGAFFLFIAWLLYLLVAH